MDLHDDHSNYIPFLRMFITSSFHLCLYLPLVSSLQDFQPAAHLLLDLITVTIFVKQHKSWRSSLCNLLQPHISFSNLGAHTISSARCSQTASICVLVLIKRETSETITQLKLCVLSSAFTDLRNIRHTQQLLYKLIYGLWNVINYCEKKHVITSTWK